LEGASAGTSVGDLKYEYWQNSVKKLRSIFSSCMIWISTDVPIKPLTSSSKAGLLAVAAAFQLAGREVWIQSNPEKEKAAERDIIVTDRSLGGKSRLIVIVPFNVWEVPVAFFISLRWTGIEREGSNSKRTTSVLVPILVCRFGPLPKAFQPGQTCARTWRRQNQEKCKLIPPPSPSFERNVPLGGLQSPMHGRKCMNNCTFCVKKLIFVAPQSNAHFHVSIVVWHFPNAAPSPPPRSTRSRLSVGSRSDFEFKEMSKEEIQERLEELERCLMSERKANEHSRTYQVWLQLLLTAAMQA
jgi:hypothetical protein